MNENKQPCKRALCSGEPFTGHEEGPNKMLGKPLTQERKDRNAELLANSAIILAAGISRLESIRTAAGLSLLVGDHQGHEWNNLLADCATVIIETEVAGLTVAEANARYKGARRWLDREMARRKAENPEAAANGGNVDNCPGCGQPHKQDGCDGADYPDSLK